MTIKIGIFDDFPLILEGLSSKLSLEDQYQVDLVESTKIGLYKNTKLGRLDVLICDIISENIIGFEVFEWLELNFPKLRVIAYSSLNNSLLIELLLLNNVKAYVHKTSDFDILKEAIDQVMKDQVFLPEEFKHLNSPYKPIINYQLTEREIEIVDLIANEKTSSEIANKLFISLSTVESHRKNIFNKLRVKNVAGMVLVASRLGYLQTKTNNK